MRSNPISHVQCLRHDPLLPSGGGIMGTMGKAGTARPRFIHFYGVVLGAGRGLGGGGGGEGEGVVWRGRSVVFNIQSDPDPGCRSSPSSG